MKAKYLILTALSCIVLVACQGNDPDNKNGKGDKQSSAIVERLDGLVDSIGSIIDSKTLKDSTVVMTDDRGNTITKDKEGNITIVTKDGGIIIIDISINEDSTSTKDKWYNTKWSGIRYSEDYGGYTDGLHEFLYRLRMYGFHLEERYISKDTIRTSIVNGNIHYLILKTTACSIHKTEMQKKYTYYETYYYVQYVVSPDSIENQGNIYRYRVEASEDSTQYYHIVYSGQMPWYRYISKDSVLIDINDGRLIDKQEELLSTSDTTIFYNYRRIDETQLAVYNNAESYIFKEITNKTKPYMSMCDMNVKQLIEFELISF